MIGPRSSSATRRLHSVFPTPVGPINTRRVFIITRVYAVLHEFTWLCTSLRDYARIYAIMQGFAQLYKGIRFNRGRPRQDPGEPHRLIPRTLHYLTRRGRSFHRHKKSRRYPAWYSPT